MENSLIIPTLNLAKQSLDLIASASYNKKENASILRNLSVTIDACVREHDKKRKVADCHNSDCDNSDCDNSEKEGEETDDQNENDGYTTPPSRKSVFSSKQLSMFKSLGKSSEKDSVKKIEKSPIKRQKLLTTHETKRATKDINYAVYHELFKTLGQIANKYKDNLIYNLDDNILFFSMREIIFILFKVKLTDESYVKFCEKIALSKMNTLREKLAKITKKSDLPDKVQKVFDRYLLNV